MLNLSPHCQGLVVSKCVVPNNIHTYVYPMEGHWKFQGGVGGGGGGLKRQIKNKEKYEGNLEFSEGREWGIDIFWNNSMLIEDFKKGNEGSGIRLNITSYLFNLPYINPNHPNYF